MQGRWPARLPDLPVLMACAWLAPLAELGATNNRRPELSRAAFDSLWLHLRHRHSCSLQKFSRGGREQTCRLGNSEPMVNVRDGPDCCSVVGTRNTCPHTIDIFQPGRPRSARCQMGGQPKPKPLARSMWLEQRPCWSVTTPSWEKTQLPRARLKHQERDECCKRNPSPRLHALGKCCRAGLLSADSYVPLRRVCYAIMSQRLERPMC